MEMNGRTILLGGHLSWQIKMEANFEFKCTVCVLGNDVQGGVIFSLFAQSLENPRRFHYL